MIPLSDPNLQGNELKYIKDCLDTGWISYAGKYVTQLEEMVKDYTGAKYAVAVVSGTAAIEMALRVVGVEQDDEVIVPTLTFIATANAIKHVGAEPIFMDCDKDLNLDPSKVIKFIKEECYFDGKNLINKSTQRRIKAILPVHILGNLARVKELKPIARRMNVAIVEDTAQALGTWDRSSKVKGHHAGTIGDIGTFSFSFNKTITAGGGGMIITNDKKLADKAKYLSLQAKDDTVFYIHNEVGYNIGMTNISAAIAVAQMEQLYKFLMKKELIHYRYALGLKEVDGIGLLYPKIGTGNYWLNGILVDSAKYGMDVVELLEELQKKGIQARPLWGLCHMQKPYLKNKAYLIENAYKYHEKTLCIPSGTTLSKEDQDLIIETIRSLGE